jgi:tetratricopeptide (TPR) repeat protein
LQGIAQPGGVLISRQAYDQVDGKVALCFRKLGPKNLKNIAKPVEVYAVDGVGGSDMVPIRGQVFAQSNIPIRVPRHFMGREGALEAIEVALKPCEGRVAITALHGLRGVGKTTLAAAYAERHRGDYRATWWIRAQTEPTMCADLVALGVRLGWVGADDEEEPALATVMERLRYEGEGVLLIFDNALDANALKPYLPTSGAVQVLVTSNAQAWRGVAAPVEIRIWPKSVGADYLQVRTGREGEREAAEALSDLLGGLPLAHEQAAAYCERLERPLADYRKRFEATPARLLDDERDAPAEYHDRLTVAKTFALAIEEAAKLDPAVEPLIVHAALLAAEPIPLFLFADGRENLDEPLAALEDEDLDEVIAALRAFALIDRETIVDERNPAIRTDTIRLHRLVRQVAAERCVGEARERAQRALMAAVAAVYPQDARNDPNTWPAARRLDGHALAMIGDDAVLSAGAEERASGLLNGLASYRHCVLAAYAQARPFYERALAIRETVLGPEHPDTAESLNNLALLLQDQGDLAGARQLHERALTIREKVLGSGHPETAESLSNLALLLQDQRDLVGARPLYERALAIYEKALGPEHPSTATSLNNLALLLQAQGNLEEARPLYERALAIYEKVLGSDHPSTATGLNNLALLIKAQGDLAGARPLYERALMIDEKVLGPDHPDTATDLSNLALLLQEQGDLAPARPLFERALAVRERVLGPDHPQTVKSLDNLASLLHDQGDLAQARPFYQRALAIREKVLGPDHPDTATDLSNLALLLQEQGDLAGARPFYERALAIYQTVLGPDHPNTNRGRRNLARLLVATGCPVEALALGHTALTAHESALGSDHVWTKDSARVTADALDALGRADDATALRARYGLGHDGR